MRCARLPCPPPRRHRPLTHARAGPLQLHRRHPRLDLQRRPAIVRPGPRRLHQRLCRLVVRIGPALPCPPPLRPLTILMTLPDPPPCAPPRARGCTGRLSSCVYQRCVRTTVGRLRRAGEGGGVTDLQEGGRRASDRGALLRAASAAAAAGSRAIRGDSGCRLVAWRGKGGEARLGLHERAHELVGGGDERAGSVSVSCEPDRARQSGRGGKEEKGGDAPPRGWPRAAAPP